MLRIDKCKDVLSIMLLMIAPYYLTYIKYIKRSLSLEDFSLLLSVAWVNSENPNQDANVSISSLINWFKQSDKTILMEEDLKIYNNLPEEFEIYRGISLGRNNNGLSWTRNLEKAEWFSHRFENMDPKGRKGYIRKAIIKKQDVLAYFNTRNEDEIVANVKNIKIVEM